VRKESKWMVEFNIFEIKYIRGSILSYLIKYISIYGVKIMGDV
jgi:hypothetical protein